MFTCKHTLNIHLMFIKQSTNRHIRSPLLINSHFDYTILAIKLFQFAIMFSFL